MTTKDAIKILKEANTWIRGADITPPVPKLFGEAIDKAIIVMTRSLNKQTKTYDIKTAKLSDIEKINLQ